MTFELGERLVILCVISSFVPSDWQSFFILLDGVPVKLVEFLHVKPGKGAAFVRSKVKNLMNGNIMEKTFRAGESIVPADVSKTEMQFTFQDGESFCFMNMETFEEQRISKDIIPNPLLLKEGT